MISFNSASSPQAEAGAFAILTVLADPVAAKAMLDQLIVVRDDANAKLDALAKLDADVNQKSTEVLLHTEDLEGRERLLAEAQEKQVADVAEHQAFVAQWDKDTKELQADLATKVKEVTEREAAVVAREESLAAHEATVNDLAAAAEALKKTYEDKLDKMRALAG